MATRVQREGESVVTLARSANIVRASVADSEDFDGDLREVDRVLRHFPSSLTNTWGCDGVGYSIERAARGVPFRNKSTIGPRQFKTGLDALTADGYRIVKAS